MAQSKPSNTKMVEDVNQGPHKKGGSGSAAPGHGQNSDELGTKNQLVPLAVGQKDPYTAKGEDWPDGKTSADVGTGQGSGATWENRDGGGKNSLVDWNTMQIGPRYAEDDGPGPKGSGSPVPTDRGSRVASQFPIEVNKGESDIDTSQTGIACDVDLQTGRIGCSGYSATRVGEVGQYNVTIAGKMGNSPGVGLKPKELK